MVVTDRELTSVMYRGTSAASLPGHSLDALGESAVPNRCSRSLRCLHQSRDERRVAGHRDVETRTGKSLSVRIPSKATVVLRYREIERLQSARLRSIRRLSKPPKQRGMLTSLFESPPRRSSSNLQRETRKEHAVWLRRHRRLSCDPMLDRPSSASGHDHHATRLVVPPGQLGADGTRIPPAAGARSVFSRCVSVFHGGSPTADRNAVNIDSRVTWTECAMRKRIVGTSRGRNDEHGRSDCSPINARFREPLCLLLGTHAPIRMRCICRARVPIFEPRNSAKYAVKCCR